VIILFQGGHDSAGHSAESARIGREAERRDVKVDRLGAEDVSGRALTGILEVDDEGQRIRAADAGKTDRTCDQPRSNMSGKARKRPLSRKNATHGLLPIFY
jgi:hypothetical protein